MVQYMDSVNLGQDDRNQTGSCPVGVWALDGEGSWENMWGDGDITQEHQIKTHPARQLTFVHVTSQHAKHTSVSLKNNKMGGSVAERFSCQPGCLFPHRSAGVQIWPVLPLHTDARKQEMKPQVDESPPPPGDPG